MRCVLDLPAVTDLKPGLRAQLAVSDPSPLIFWLALILVVGEFKAQCTYWCTFLIYNVTIRPFLYNLFSKETKTTNHNVHIRAG